MIRPKLYLFNTNTGRWHQLQNYLLWNDLLKAKPKRRVHGGVWGFTGIKLSNVGDSTGLKLENYYFFTFTFSWPEVGKLFLIYFFTFSFSWPEVGKLFLIYFFTFSWPEVGKLFLIYFFTFSRPEVGKLFRIYVFLDLNLENYSIFRWLSARLQLLQRISNGITAVLH